MAGLAATSGQQSLGANFAAAGAAQLEEAKAAENGLACMNLAGLVAHMFTCGLVQATTVYSLLAHLTSR